jgi:hypothetical protein
MIYMPSLSERLFTRLKSKLIIVFFCWLVPALMLVPSLFRLYGQHGRDCRSRSCTILKDHEQRNPKYFFLASGLFIPGVVLVIANALIYYKVKLDSSMIWF